MSALPLTKPLASEGTLAAAIAALKQRFGEKLSTARAVREHHGRDVTFHEGLPDAVVYCRSTGGAGGGAHLRRSGADHSLPHRHLARGPARSTGVTLDLSEMNAVLEVNAPPPPPSRRARPPSDERGAGGERGRPGLPRAGRRDAQAAERVRAPRRPDVPDRPGRRRLAGRHGGDPGLGHQRGALRHHARERAGAHGGDCRWTNPENRRAARASRPPDTI